MDVNDMLATRVEHPLIQSRDPDPLSQQQPVDTSQQHVRTQHAA